MVFNLDKEHFGDIENASEEQDKTFFRRKKFETRSNLRFCDLMIECTRNQLASNKSPEKGKIICIEIEAFHQKARVMVSVEKKDYELWLR